MANIFMLPNAEVSGTELQKKSGAEKIKWTNGVTDAIQVHKRRLTASPQFFQFAQWRQA